MAERLTVEDAVKIYPGGNHALKGPSFGVEPGMFMVLLGPSGSGKTTLLRALAGIERLSSGRVTIGGTLVADGRVHVPPERRDLAMVFQDYALWPHLSVRDNVAFALRRHKPTKVEARRRAGDMLARVGLGHLAERFPAQLSGGEQQRVALARALVGDTGLLLCDEPLSNLDADLRERMRVEISSLVREAGTTTVYITHDQHEAFALADRVGVLESGELIQVGTPEDVYRDPHSLFVARFTGLAGELTVTVAGPGRSSGTVVVEPVGLPTRRPIEARRSETIRVGRRATLVLRPTAVRLCSHDSPDAHLSAEVSDTAFRGRHYELIVDLGGGRRLAGVVADRRLPRGTAVGIAFEPGGSIVFDLEPGDEGSGAGAGCAGPVTTVTTPTPAARMP